MKSDFIWSDIEHKIECLRYFGEDLKFRSKYKIPAAGLGDINAVERWLKEIKDDKSRYQKFERNIVKKRSEYGFRNSEIKILTDYLLLGSIIISGLPEGVLRLRIRRSKTGKSEYWLRVDGLTKEQILGEIDRFNNF